MAESFAGFDAGLTAFLRELEQNNERGWFQANRPRYEALVREPARAFIRAMAPRLAAISPHFTADDRKQGGSLMRVHRDTRFAKDKAPYKTNVGIQFRHEAGKDVHAPGFYVHIEPGSVFIGAGVWHPDATALRRIRAFIDEHDERWRAAVGDPRFTRLYRREGGQLRNPPRGFPKDHPMLDELKRTDHIALHDLDPSEVEGAEVADRVADRFAAAGGYVGLLCEALGVRY